MTTFENLRECNATRQRGWDPSDAITIEFRGNELAGEVGELCNLIKKLARERIGLRGIRTNRWELSGELADVVICADLIAMDLGIDLGASVRNKFNETSRKYNLETLMRLEL